MIIWSADDDCFVPMSPPYFVFRFFLLANCAGRAAGQLRWSKEGAHPVFFPVAEAIIGTIVTFPSVGSGCGVTLGVAFKSIWSAVSAV